MTVNENKMLLFRKKLKSWDKYLYTIIIALTHMMFVSKT